MSNYKPIIQNFGLMNQYLISRYLDYGVADNLPLLQNVDTKLQRLWVECKAEIPTQYIWRTRGDDKVRGSHAANNGKVFSRDNPPPTGNPGDEFGCRCWAEPIGGDDQYVQQTLNSKINDNVNRWSNWDFVRHYFFGGGISVNLQETGYLEEVVNYYANEAVARDGNIGVYHAVNQQIINKALNNGEGVLTERFDGTYNFQKVLYTLRNSNVSGKFEGEVRKEEKFLVISGTITYNFSDKFKDPLSFVEALQKYLGMTRQEAEKQVSEAGDFAGVVYEIKDNWQTKFNATVRLDNNKGIYY